MSNIIRAQDSTEGWLLAAQYLMGHRGDCYNLLVDIEDAAAEDPQVRRILNDFLVQNDLKLVEEVANTIFPISLYERKMGRPHLYEQYALIWPLLRLFHENRNGTYFQRMIQWKSGTGHINQLEETIRKLTNMSRGRQRLRSAYEIGIFRPDNDGRNRRGFPCLSHLSFKLDGEQLHLTAVYRNQYYIERAYGNFIGLGRLLQFVASESELVPGRLTCLATHAQLETVPGGRAAIRSLVEAYLRTVPGASQSTT